MMRSSLEPCRDMAAMSAVTPERLLLLPLEPLLSLRSEDCDIWRRPRPPLDRHGLEGLELTVEEHTLR